MKQVPHFQSKTYAIIVAGGSGIRMQSAIPKQFLLLNDKPVLMHTLSAFSNSGTKPHLILVLHPDFHTYWEQLCADHNFNIPYHLVNGGDTRFHSVQNGLGAINDINDALVAVQDAIRPLTSKQIIDGSYQHAAELGNAVTAVKSRDSVRQLRDNVFVSLIRDEIYLMQTPQTFKLHQLKKAYLQPYDIKFTDDASVVEASGIMINLFEGSYDNLKITFPEDIVIAEVLMKKGS